VPDFYFMLTPKAIEKLKVIYRKRYGEELNDSQAFEMGNRLLNLFRTVLKPLPGNESAEFNKTKICQQEKEITKNLMHCPRFNEMFGQYMHSRSRS